MILSFHPKQTVLAIVFSIATMLGANAQTLKDAIKYTDNEQFEKATSAFKSLLAANPTGDVYFYFGDNYFKSDDIDSAKIIYQKGAAQFPTNPLLVVGLGKIFLNENKIADAKKQFFAADVLCKDKTNKLNAQQKAQVYIEIAEAYINTPNKDAAEAINQVNKAIELDKKSAEAHITLGDILFEQNPVNGSAAIVEYKKAAEMDKTSPKALFKIGELYLKAKNAEEALKYLDQAIALEKSFAPAYRVKAEAFYFRNNLDKAIAEYKNYLDLNHGNISARVRYASFLFVAKKYTESINEIKLIQKEAANINLLNRLLGYAYTELGDVANGIAAMDAYFAKQPENKIIASDYEYYARLFVKSGNDSLGLINYNKALAKDSTKVDLYPEVAAVYLKQKKYGEAARLYKKKIETGKNVNINDYYYLGSSYYYNSEFGKADTAFIEYTKIQKDIGFGYLWRAKSNAQLDPKSEKWLAKPYFEQFILKTKPEEVEKNKKNLEDAYSYLGYYYFVQKDLPSAKCCYLKIKELNAGTDKTQKALDALAGPELKNVTPATECIKEQPAQ